MRSMVVFAAVGLVAALACSKKAAREDRPPAGALEGAANRATADGGPNAMEVVTELAFGDGGSPVGVWVTALRDAPQGVHLRFSLRGPDGNTVGEDRVVAACTGALTRDTPVLVPLEVDDDGAPVVEAARTAVVVFAQHAPGCLRPSLRVERMARPAGN